VDVPKRLTRLLGNKRRIVIQKRKAENEGNIKFELFWVLAAAYTEKSNVSPGGGTKYLKN